MLLRRVLVVAWCAAVCGAVFAPAPFPLQRSFGTGVAGAAATSATHTATAHRGSATVGVTVQPSQGRVVGLAVTVSVTRPHGALAYAVAYGDGTTTSLPVPQICAQSGRPSASRTWLVHHRYRHPGTYRVVVTGWAVCTAGRPKAAVEVTAG